MSMPVDLLEGKWNEVADSLIRTREEEKGMSTDIHLLEARLQSRGKV